MHETQQSRRTSAPASDQPSSSLRHPSAALEGFASCLCKPCFERAAASNHFVIQFRGFLRRVFATAVLSIFFLVSVSAHTQTGNPQLETFKRFVNGDEPIREAVVYRSISLASGKLINQDWLRFGYQDGGNTWYAQRLRPATNDHATLAPVLDADDMNGASYKYLWGMNERNLQIAEKSLAAGSGPAKSGAFLLEFIHRALTLGIPSIEPAKILFAGTNFNPPAITRWTPVGEPQQTNMINGSLVLGERGLPVSAEYSPSGTLPGGIVSYSYEPATKGIPHVFSVTSKQPNGRVYRYEFLTLILGAVDLSETQGYLPTMFTAAKIEKHITLWTNSAPYSLIDGKTIPAFATTHQRRTGALIMGGLLLSTTVFLALIHRRLKMQQQKQQHT